MVKTAPFLYQFAHYQAALSLGARTLIAVVAGYGITALFSVMLAMCLPLSKADSTLTATMLSFVIYAMTIIYAFSVKRIHTLLSHFAVTAMVLFIIMQIMVTS